MKRGLLGRMHAKNAYTTRSQFDPFGTHPNIAKKGSAAKLGEREEPSKMFGQTAFRDSPVESWTLHGLAGRCWRSKLSTEKQANGENGNAGTGGLATPAVGLPLPYRCKALSLRVGDSQAKLHGFAEGGRCWSTAAPP